MHSLRVPKVPNHDYDDDDDEEEDEDDLISDHDQFQAKVAFLLEGLQSNDTEDALFSHFCRLQVSFFKVNLTFTTELATSLSPSSSVLSPPPPLSSTFSHFLHQEFCVIVHFFCLIRILILLIIFIKKKDDI